MRVSCLQRWSRIGLRAHSEKPYRPPSNAAVSCREHIPRSRWPSSTATKFAFPFLKISATLSTDALAGVAVRWLTRTRRSIDSARTGGLKSIGAEETCSSRCAVACIDISLSDFENDGVLQIDDISPDHNWLHQTEHDRIALD